MQHCDSDGQMMLFSLEEADEIYARPPKRKSGTLTLSTLISIPIIRLSAKGTDGVMKRRCFRLKLMFAILFTGVLGILQRPWR